MVVAAAVATVTTTPADPRLPRTVAPLSAAALVVGVPAARILLLSHSPARPSRRTWTHRLAAVVVTDGRTCCPEDLVEEETCSFLAAMSVTTEAAAAVAANAASVAPAATGRPVRASRRRVAVAAEMIRTSVEAARRRPWRISLDRRYRTSRRGRAGAVEEVVAALAAAAMTGRAAAAAAAIIAIAGGACVVVVIAVDGVVVPAAITMSAACLAALVPADRTAEDRRMAKAAAAAAVDAACATDRAMVVVVVAAVGAGSRVSCGSRGRAVAVVVARRGSRGSRGIGRGIGVVGMLIRVDMRVVWRVVAAVVAAEVVVVVRGRGEGGVTRRGTVVGGGRGGDLFSFEKHDEWAWRDGMAWHGKALTWHSCDARARDKRSN